MDDRNRVQKAIDDYQRKWRHPDLPTLKISEPYDTLFEYERVYPNSDHPGVYFIFGNKFELSYIGKAMTLGSRIHSYFDRPSAQKKLIFKYDWNVQPRYIQTVAVAEPFEAPSLEEFLIRELDPPDNTRGRPFNT